MMTLLFERRFQEQQRAWRMSESSQSTPTTPWFGTWRKAGGLFPFFEISVSSTGGRYEEQVRGDRKWESEGFACI
jgi:hypothetical protein